MKALHPSDHEIKATRVPGGTSNTLALAIDQTFTVAPYGSGPLRMQLYPNVMTPFMVCFPDSENAPNTRGTFTPPVFSGLGYTEGMLPASTIMGMYNTMRDNFESIRITSESVTVNFIAPALASQGTVVAAQYAQYPQKFVFTTAGNQTNFTFDGDTSTGQGKYPSRLAYAYDPPADKSKLLAGTRAYTAKAVEGVYMPLRLTDFKWRNLASSMGKGRYYVEDAHSHNLVHTPIDLAGRDYACHSIDLCEHIWDTEALWTVDFGNTIGQIEFDGFDRAQCSFEVRFRMTIEARVMPGSTYAPLCQLPPLSDDLAMKMYREIAGRMQNAYPASYNDWDGLKRTIKGIARGVLTVADPLINLVSWGLPMGKPIASIATSATEGLRKWLGEEKSYDVPTKQQAIQADTLKAVNQAITAAIAKSKPKPQQRRKAKPKRGNPQADLAKQVNAIVKQAMGKMD